MRNFLNLILSIVLCAALPIISLAQAAVNAKQELIAIYAAHDKAIAARDVKTIAAFYAPNYVAETEQGSINRYDSLKTLQDFFDTTDEISSAKTTLEKVEQIEGITVAFITRRIKGLMIFAAGKRREFEVNTRSEDHWIKTAKGVWTMHAGIERNQTLKVDGIIENADVLESSRTYLEAVYEKIDAALKTRNLGAMFVYWAPDFTEIQGGKESASNEAEAAFNALFAKISVVSSVTHKINNIKTVDGNYVVEVTRTIEGDMTIKSKKVFFEYSYQASESWSEPERGLWKLKTSEILNDKFLINGKEVK
jgi:ketosteroid isomerase-like protein